MSIYPDWLRGFLISGAVLLILGWMASRLRQTIERLAANLHAEVRCLQIVTGKHTPPTASAPVPIQRDHKIPESPTGEVPIISTGQAPTTYSQAWQLGQRWGQMEERRRWQEQEA